MSEKALISDYHTPVYNIKAVARLVGLLPVTLRAWERRYGLPVPKRSGQGYRLYSEHDVRTLRWLKSHVDSGLSIGRASDLLQDLRVKGQDPVLESVPLVDQSTNLTALKKMLLAALRELSEYGAIEILRRAFALYTLDQVLVELIQPILVDLGEEWHANKLPIAVEHFATQFFVQHLMSMLAAAGTPIRSGTIVAAGAPGEMHHVGLLMLVVMLRWRGWDVKYLGPDLKLERLAEGLEPVHPRLLMFTATRPESAVALQPLGALLAHFPPPAPLVVLGGQAFQQIKPAGDLPGVVLSGSPQEMIQTIENMLASQPKSRN
jgi:DNA-binding transcriptional MerR regulator